MYSHVERVSRNSTVICTVCKGSVTSYTLLKQNNDHGDFEARVCDACLIAAVKRYILQKAYG